MATMPTKIKDLRELAEELKPRRMIYELPNGKAVNIELSDDTWYLLAFIEKQDMEIARMRPVVEAAMFLEAQMDEDDYCARYKFGNAVRAYNEAKEVDNETNT